MTHTEAMQLIKRTQCKLRPSSSPTLPSSLLRPPAWQWDRQKAAKSRSGWGVLGHLLWPAPLNSPPQVFISCAFYAPTPTQQRMQPRKTLPQKYCGSIICIAFSPRTTIGRSAKGISPLPVALVEGRRRAQRYPPGTTDSLGARKAKAAHQINPVVAQSKIGRRPVEGFYARNFDLRRQGRGRDFGRP